MSTTEPGCSGLPLARPNERAVAEIEDFGTVEGPVTDISLANDINGGWEYTIDGTWTVDEDALR